MADTPKLAKAEIASKDEEEPKRPPNPFSLFSKLPLFNFNNFNFLPSKPETAKPDVVAVVSVKSTRTVDGDEGGETKPVVVKFPDAWPAIPPPPLKLEAEESEQNTNPVVLWQVYAIGGVFILRWLWARWNERRAKKGSSDEEPCPADD